MAVNFVVRKCACGGKLEFDPAKKIWVCKYCGTVVEREATFDRIQVDGIEGINDVVRQTLMDVANNKLDSAGKNLEDCERKNHKHVGTLIANVSYYLAMIAAANSPDEARSNLDKVKIYAKRLNEEYPTIAEDEINLYEAFGEGVADIYANLLVVYDTLNDAGRVEYISSKLKPEEIFSEHANRNLLKIAIKRENYGVVEAVVRNVNHIDLKFSLQEIMSHYPDTEKKAELINLLFNVQVAESFSKGFFEQYFCQSSDSLQTKTLILKKLAATNLRCNAETIAKAIYSQMDGYESAKEVFLALYEVKVSDLETEALLVFCLMVNKSFDVLTAFLDALLEKDIFVQLNSRAVISFMDSSPFEIDQKLDVLKRMFRFEIDGKALDAIYNYYLNNNHDDADSRLKIIELLLTENCPITSNTVKNYFVHTEVDSDNKLTVVEKIFATGINKTYVGDLLSEYLLRSQDTQIVRGAISEYLINQGFKVDSAVLSQYVTSTKDAVEVKIHMIKRLIASGSQVKAECLGDYILSLQEPDEFSSQIFDVLSSYSFTMGTDAYAKFLISCKDMDRARHNTKLVSALNADLNGIQLKITHNGMNITCNLLQAYVLTTDDTYDTAKSIVDELVSAKAKLNTEMSVNGSVMKFKKYVGERKAELSPLVLQICEENRMFSFF